MKIVHIFLGLYTLAWLYLVYSLYMPSGYECQITQENGHNCYDCKCSNQIIKEHFYHTTQGKAFYDCGPVINCETNFCDRAPKIGDQMFCLPSHSADYFLLSHEDKSLYTTIRMALATFGMPACLILIIGLLYGRSK